MNHMILLSEVIVMIFYYDDVSTTGNMDPKCVLPLILLMHSTLQNS